jgi:heme/copper-type cytochrome/quinol oxidase subunit 2
MFTKAARTHGPRAGRGAISTGLMLVALVSSACVEQPATSQAQHVRTLFYVILALAAPVFIGVEGALLWSIVRYRRRKGDDGSEPPQREGTTRTIVVFFLIGAVIVAVLFPFGEIVLADVQAHPPAVESIQIQGSQWQWSAFYPNEGVVTSGKSCVSPSGGGAGSGHACFGRPLVMEIPVDTTVHIHLISTDVMHEFFVPSFFFMRNALAGHPNDFTWTPDTIGTFHGQCAEFCGLGHYQMRFEFKVVSETDFLAWVKQERQTILKIDCPTTSGNLQITAHNISWDTNCLHVPEGASVPISVMNLDEGINHNFAIWDGIDTAHQFFATGKFPGVATRTETIPALKPGKYYFQCNVHGPAMSGVFIVGGLNEGGG